MRKKQAQKSLVDRIMENVSMEPNTGCWLWLGATNNKGYGVMTVGSLAYKNRKLKSAHRVSYEVFNGPIIKGNILHKCDTPSCVNPDHLFDGTLKDNSIDMVKKGRCKNHLFKGKKPINTKLTKEQVLYIKKHYRYRHKEFNSTKLAEKFGVNKSVVKDIICGRSWSDV